MINCSLLVTQEEPHKRDRSLSYKLHKLPITDDLKHIVDENQHPDTNNLNDNLTSSDLNNSLRQPSVTEFDESQFIKKLFIFKKTASDQSDDKQSSLAQIIKNLNKDPESDQTEPESQSSTPAYAPPYPIGIRLKTKTNQLEIGNHIISAVEPGSPADIAGLKVNSRLDKLNDVTCDDKTHEFVIFYLNYILRKNTCQSIEMIVDEPFTVPTKPTRSNISFRRYDNEATDLLTNTDPLFDQTSSQSTLQATEEPSKIQSALAALTKIVAVGTADEDNTENLLAASSNDFVQSDNLMTHDLDNTNNNKGSNENLKAIIQSIIWRPPFHKSDGSLFHSDSFESNISNTHSSITQDDDSNVNLKGICRDVLYHKKSTTSLDQQNKPNVYDETTKQTSIIASLIASHKSIDSVDVNQSHTVQKGEQFTSSVEASTATISTSGVHSAFAALTKVTAMGATTEEKAATVSSFSQQQEQQKISVNEQGFTSVQANSFESNQSISAQKQQFTSSIIQSNKAESSNIQSALAALTKITSLGTEEENEPVKPSDNMSFLPMPYPYDSTKHENENIRTIVIEATHTESTLKPEPFITYPYPYDRNDTNLDNVPLNDRIVSTLTGGDSSDTQQDKPKSIQSALAALTKITSLGSDFDSSILDATSTNYEILPIGIGNQQNNNNQNEDELSESDLLKLYRYQGRVGI